MEEIRTFIGSEPAKTGPGIGLLFSAFPNVDDHLVEPEVSRDEIVGGRRVVASPAETDHADQHSRLDYVLQAHVASGYRVSVDLITRHGPITDFASDACVRREGIDPATGRRHLEEIAFEVVSQQRERLATEKAEHMRRRPAILARYAAAEAKGEAKGLTKGAARALLKFLVARGLEVSEAQRQEILGCQDLDRLDRWLDRAATASSASSASEVLAEP